MKCLICGKNEASAYPRPIGMGGLGEAETQVICDECYSKRLEERRNP